jgi:hypothetical protein
LVASVALRRSGLESGLGGPHSRSSYPSAAGIHVHLIPDWTWMASEAGLARFPSHDGGLPPTWPNGRSQIAGGQDKRDGLATIADEPRGVSLGANRVNLDHLGLG